MRIFGITVLTLVLAGCSRQVEVKTGTRIVCEKCDKVIENNVETKLVATAEAEKYIVEKVDDLCDSCKPEVELKVSQNEWGDRIAFLVCPLCGTKVDKGRGECPSGNPSHKFKPVDKTCPDCRGTGKVDCRCRNFIAGKCGLCGGAGGNRYGTVFSKCANCFGDGRCIGCKGTLKEKCFLCKGQGIY